MMKLVLVFALVASFFAENLLLPVGKERQREDVVTRCLVEVLSKALTKPDSHPLDQECKDILKAGAQHAALLEKKSDEEVLTHKEEVKGHEPELEVPGADVKDIEARLKSVEEKRETPEDEERSQESWDLNAEKEKRIWKPTHRYHHKEVSEEKREEPDEERSQESWSLGDEKEKRYRPTYRYTPKKLHIRDDKSEKCSQESWDLKDEKEKREEEEEREKRMWKPPHRYHHKKHHKRGADSSEEESEEKRSDESEEEEDREKRIWKPTNRYHHNKRHQRSGDSSAEEEEERRSDSDEQEEKRYLAEKRSEVESRLLGEIDEKRSPWAYRGYYHPAWWKRGIEPLTPSHKMEELAKLLKRHQLASQSEPAEERQKSIPLTPEEEKELQNLAAMDMELQKIAEKMHENRSK
uniref:secretogranin-1 isoform X2 n=1 Tax=Oncorhynchus gorbuscha TaxID=8017 RepID=UPI001EAF3705|nr:secretogranin-1 isoform X2 [Oncorhynchus gorbuscha]